MTKRAKLTVIRTILIGCIALMAASCGVEGTASTEAGGSTIPAVTITAPSNTSTTDGDRSTTEPDRTTSTTEADATTTRPGSSVDSVTRAALIDGFKTVGLTDAQATCMADSYIDLGLTDPEAQPDVDNIFNILEKCNVSLTDLSGGADLGGGTN